MDRILIAMSGGVDSSVAAYAVCKEGHPCGGILLHLCDNGNPSPVQDAEAVAQRLGMDFHHYGWSRYGRSRPHHVYLGH